MGEAALREYVASLMDTSFDRRTPEPEAMEETADEYASIDFSESNAAFVRELAVVIPERAFVADLGCGPGDIPILLAVARPDLSIVGLDLSPAMLEIAAQRAAEAGVGDRLRWRVGDVAELVFDVGELDFVYSHTTLHHLPNIRACFEQTARALRQGGGYYLRDLRRPASAREAAEWIETASGDSLTARQYALFFYSLLASYTPDEVELDLAAASLHSRVVVPPEYNRYWVASGTR